MGRLMRGARADTAERPPARGLSIDSAKGRWIIAGSVLGSGAVFLEGSIVSVALPSIGRDLRLGIAGLQWVMNGYLLTLTALMLLGGALGDRFRRSRVFAIGLVGFGVATICCALAPNALLLVGCRVLQGAFGALLVPNSLAMLETSFDGEARGTAIGRWSAWSAISSAVGPLLGGWLVDATSWRWVFASVMPFAFAAAWIVFRHGDAADRGVAPGAAVVAAGERPQANGVDYKGAALATLGLAGIVGALIAGPSAGFASPAVLGAAAVGVVCAVGFLVVERHAEHPLLPLDVFRSRAFTGANIVTLLVYAALGGLFFLLMLELQDALGYSGLVAGVSLLPASALMLLLSPSAGRLAHRIGPRLPMTAGAVVAAAGMALFARVRPGASYLGAVLPAAVVFGLGLSLVVAPLTTAVLGAVGDQLAGVASAVNNAVARLGSLLATAALPLAAGLGGLQELRGSVLAAGFARAMWITAALCTVGALVAWTTIPGARRSKK
jgi:EmrB/QacA subfamily drug resistance transporter